MAAARRATTQPLAQFVSHTVRFERYPRALII